MSQEGDAMSRSARSRIPVEDKVRIVLSVLRGEMSVSEAARRRGCLAWRSRSGSKRSSRQARRPSNHARAVRPEPAVGRRSGDCGSRTNSSNSPSPRPRCSCGSSGTAVSSVSLHRPRSPESGTTVAGFEVRAAGRNPGTHLPPTPGPTPCWQAAAPTAAVTATRSVRGDRGAIRRGVAGVGASQDRGVDAR